MFSVHIVCLDYPLENHAKNMTASATSVAPDQDFKLFRFRSSHSVKLLTVKVESVQMFWRAMVCKCSGELWCATVLESYGVQLFWRVMVCNCSGELWCAIVLESYGVQMFWRVMVCKCSGHFFLKSFCL